MLVGAVVLRLTVTDTYRRYVRPGMGKWLLIAGVLVIALGAFTLVQVAAQRATRGSDTTTTTRTRTASASAGSCSLRSPRCCSSRRRRSAPTASTAQPAVNIRPGKPTFTRMPRNAPPRAMTLLEYVAARVRPQRRELQRRHSRADRLHRREAKGGFRLARYQIACCAADATPVVVDVVGTSGATPTQG